MTAKTEKTFSALLAEWKEARRNELKPASFATYCVLLDKHALPVLGDKTVVTTEDLQSLVDAKLAAGMRPKQVRDLYNIINNVLRFGAKCGFGPAPEEKLNLPVAKTEPAVWLPLEEEKKLLAAIEQDPTGRNLAVWLALMLGLRTGELCALRWRDLDMKAGLLHISTPASEFEKGSGTSQRHLPLPEEMRNFLAPYRLRKHPDGYIVTNRREPVKPKTLQRHLTALCEECHLAPVTFQQLRHTFAKRCLESGCDFVTLSLLLGHARIAQTMDQYGSFVHPAPKQALQALFGILTCQE